MTTNSLLENLVFSWIGAQYLSSGFLSLGPFTLSKVGFDCLGVLWFVDELANVGLKKSHYLRRKRVGGTCAK